MGNRHEKPVDIDLRYREIITELEKKSGHELYSRYDRYKWYFVNIFDNNDLTNPNESIIVYDILGLYYSFSDTNKNDSRALVNFVRASVEYNSICGNSDNPSAYVNMGDFYLRKDDKINSLKCYMIAYDTNHLTAIERMAFWYHLVDKDVKKAIKYYEEALKHGSTNVLSDYGHLCLEIKNYGKAVELFTKACSNNLSSKSLNNLAHCLLLDNKPHEALKYFYEAYCISAQGDNTELIEMAGRNVLICLEQLTGFEEFKNIEELCFVIGLKTVNLSDENVKEFIGEIISKCVKL